MISGFMQEQEAGIENSSSEFENNKNVNEFSGQSNNSSGENSSSEVAQNTENQKDSLDKNKIFQQKLRNFKIASSSNVREWRKRTEYVPPSVKRKIKSKEAAKRRRNLKYRSGRGS